MFGLNSQQKLENIKAIYNRNEDPFPNIDRRAVAFTNPCIFDNLKFNDIYKNYQLLNAVVSSKPYFSNNFNNFENNFTNSFVRNTSVFNNSSLPIFDIQTNNYNSNFTLDFKYFVDNQTNL